LNLALLFSYPGYEKGISSLLGIWIGHPPWASPIGHPSIISLIFGVFFWIEGIVKLLLGEIFFIRKIL